MIKYIGLFLVLVFISSLSQVLLKLSAQKSYENIIKSYLNPLVIISYLIFLSVTMGTLYCYKFIPLSYGPVLETIGYFFVTVWGVLFFKEKINMRKLVALVFIVAGVIIYTV